MDGGLLMMGNSLCGRRRLVRELEELAIGRLGELERELLADLDQTHLTTLAKAVRTAGIDSLDCVIFDPDQQP